MTAPRSARAAARRRRAAQAMLAGATLAGGVSLAANAAGANPVPTPTVEVIDDTLFVRGTDAGDDLALRLSAADPDVVEFDAGNDGVVDASTSRATFSKIAVELYGGDDQFRIDDTNGVFTDTEVTTIDSGDGTDFVSGGGGAETVVAGGGDDFVDGGRGNDLAFLGAGDDQFQWDPGEGSDVVEGEGDQDVMIFNGSGADEKFDASANGERVRFFRDAGNIVMDLNYVEVIDLAALGGADNVVVNDLSGTDLIALNADLESVKDGVAPDGTADTVTVNGTAGDDVAVVSGAAVVDGLPYQVELFNADPALDRLNLNTQAGNDLIDASPLSPDAVLFSVDGGDGDETITGSSGTDFVDGGRGTDTALLGDGNDTFQWDPGEGSDVVEGQAGFDVMLFNGSGADERFEALADGPRVTFTRDVGNIVMDLDGVERIDLDALGGRDSLVVNDLAGTALQELRSDLEAVKDGGAPDTAVDTVTVVGTRRADFVDVLGSGDSLFVLGLTPFLTIDGQDSTDVLEVLGRAGDDRISASSLRAEAISLAVSGGVGDDQLSGGDGADSLNGGGGDDFVDGGAGDDTAAMGAGDDIFRWNPGDGNDRGRGGAGRDALVFSGSSANERFAVAPDGARGATVTRDVDDVSVRLDRVESLSVFSFGGTDTLLVDDLAQRAGLEAIDASFFDFGVPGGQVDVLVVNGSDAADAITVTGNASTTTVTGLPASIRVTGVEINDRVEVNSRGGDDVIDSTGLAPDGMRFLADAGADDDVVLGGAGDDVLSGGDGADVLFAGSGDNVVFGGDGDDVLRGEEGDDVLDGGAGDDILIGNAGDDVLLNGEVIFDE